MILQRRAFLTGLGVSLIAAPAIERAGSLMPVRAIRPPPFVTIRTFAPAAPVVGDVYVDVSTGFIVRLFNGLAWQEFDPVTFVDLTREGKGL